jgi:biotin carboxyl carrier protein
MRKFRVVVNGIEYIVEAEELAAGAAIAPPAIPTPARAESLAPPAAPAQAPVAAAPAGAEKILCPMPCVIIDIRATVGQSVKKGDVVLVFEAMKMEQEMLSPRDAVIASIDVAQGDNITTGGLLYTLI